MVKLESQKSMKILQVHNKYKKRGGEETVVEEERRVLEEKGHTVIQYLKDSTALEKLTKGAFLELILSQRGSKKIEREFDELLKQERPDICHVHNVYPIITPVIYGLCKRLNIPVVQTLHNFKLICTNGLLFRDGQTCEVCINKSLYNSIKHKCYRDSYLATAIQADAIQYHRKAETWQNQIDRYICLTDFQKSKLVTGGLPAEKISIKPNFIQQSSLSVTLGDYFLFIGRLDEAKGVHDLLELIHENREAKFIIIGDSDNPTIFERYDNVMYLGKQNRNEVLHYLSKCRAVIFSSKLYEGMPMVIIEAFSMKKAVVGRNIGALSSMVDDGITGLKYNDIAGLISAVDRLNGDEKLCLTLGFNAYQEYMKRYTESIGYENLVNIYLEVTKFRADGI